jgi:hypothetical protein
MILIFYGLHVCDPGITLDLLAKMVGEQIVIDPMDKVSRL